MPNVARLRRRSFALLRAGILAFSALVIAGGGWSQYHAYLEEKEDVLTEAIRDLDVLLRSLDEHLVRTFHGADVVLQVMADRLEASLSRGEQPTDEAHALFDVLRQRSPQFRILAAADAAGRPVAMSARAGYVVPPLNLGTMDLFTQPRDQQAQTTIVLPPRPSAVDRQQVVPLARRLQTSDGRFLGVVVGILDVNYFESFYTSLQNNVANRISIFTADGTLVTRTEPGARPARAPAFVDRLPVEPSGAYWQAADESSPARHIVYRKTSLPYVITATIPEDILANRIHAFSKQAITRAAVIALAFGALAALLIIATYRRESLAGELSRSETRFRDFADAATDWYWEMGPDLRFTYFSDTPNSVRNEHRRQMIGMRRDETVDPATQSAAWRQHLDDMENRRPFREVIQTVALADDTMQFVKLSGKPIFDRAGTFLGYRGTATDLTSQTRAAQIAERSQMLLVEAVNAIHEGIAIFDADERLVISNAHLDALYPQAAGLFRPGTHIDDILRNIARQGEHKGLSAQNSERWVVKRRERRRANGVDEYQLPGGRHLRLSVVQLADGGFVTLHTEITRDKQREAALAASESRFRDFAEAVSDGYWEMDAALRYIFITSMTDEDLAQQFIGKHRWDLVDPEDQDERWRSHLDDMRNERPFRDVHQRRALADGTVIYASLSGKPVYDDAGKFQGYRGTTTDITKTVVAEQQADRLQRLLAEAVETVPAGFILYGPDDRLVLCNERYRQFNAQWPHICVPGTRFEDIARLGTKHNFYGALDSNIAAAVEKRIELHRTGGTHDRQMPDGQWLRISEVRLADGSTVGIHTDITEDKRREAQLQELAAKNALLADAVDTISTGIVLYDPDDRVVFCNEGYRRLYAHAPEFYKPGMHFEDIMANAIGRMGDTKFSFSMGVDNDIEAASAKRIELHRTGGTHDRLHPDGQWRRVSEVRLADGSIIGIHTDITADKRREAELENLAAKNALLAEAVKTVPAGFVLYDPDDRLILCNERYRQFYAGTPQICEPGIRFEDVARIGAMRLRYKSLDTDIDTAIAKRIELHRSGGTHDRQLPDGEWRRISEVQLPDGSIVGIHADITEDKRREAALQELAAKNALFATAIENSSCAILISDPQEDNRPIVYVNAAFETLTGYSKEEVLGKSAALLYGPKTDPEGLRALYSGIETGKPVQVSLQHYRKDGTPIHFNVNVAPVRDANGTVTHIVSVRTDITARIEAENRLRDFADAGADFQWETDADLRFTYFSPAAKRIIGIEPEQMYVHTPEIFRNENSSAEWWETILDDFRNHRAVRNLRFSEIMRHGTQVHLELNAKPIFDEDGRFKGYRGSGTDITSEVTAEQNAARSRQQLSDAVDALTDGFVLFDANDQLVICNEQYRQLHSPVADILIPGTHIDKIFRRAAYSGLHPSANGREDEWIAERIRDYRAAGRHYRELSDGRWLSIRSVVLADGSLAAIHSDVTAEKRREAELAELAGKNALLAAAVEMTGSGIVITDPTQPGRPIVYVNPAFSKLTGFSFEDAVGQSFRLLTGPESDPDIGGEIHAALSAGQPIKIRQLGYRKDGTHFDVDLSISPVRDASGAITHFVGVHNDITAHIQAAERLRASEERLRNLADNVPGIIFQRTHRPDGSFYFSYMSERCFDLSGDTAEQLRLDPTQVGSRVHPEDRDTYRHVFLDAMRDMKPAEYEFRFTHRITGEMRWARSLFKPHPAPNGDVIIDGVVLDITDHKLAAERLRENEERLRMIAESMPGILFQRITDRNGVNRYEFISKRIVDHTGYTVAELFENPSIFQNMIVPEDRARMEKAFAPISDAEMKPFEMEYRMRIRSGEVRWFNTMYTPRRAANGDTIWDGMSFDITRAKTLKRQRRELESQLRHSQRIDALGTLAGGMAHDVNNTLVPILALSKLTHKALPDDSPHKNNMQSIIDATYRIRDLVARVLAFSRKQTSQARPLRLQTVIASTVHLLNVTLPPNIKLVQQVDETIPDILGDKGELEQVVTNLCTNAAHAIGQANGQISIELTAVELAETDKLPGELLPGPHARIRVTDTGAGIAPADLTRIFEPFFTTKEVGEGTGLGLSVVHGTVTGHRGSITVDSIVGQGTTFTLYFPIATAADNDAASRSAPDADAALV